MGPQHLIETAKLLRLLPYLTLPPYPTTLWSISIRKIMCFGFFVAYRRSLRGFCNALETGLRWVGGVSFEAEDDPIIVSGMRWGRHVFYQALISGFEKRYDRLGTWASNAKIMFCELKRIIMSWWIGFLVVSRVVKVFSSVLVLRVNQSDTPYPCRIWYFVAHRKGLLNLIAFFGKSNWPHFKSWYSKHQQHTMQFMIWALWRRAHLN